MRLNTRMVLALTIFVVLVTVTAQTTAPAALTAGNTGSSYEIIPNDGSVASETIETWHHDCSNLTAFDGIGDNTWPHDSVVTVTFGTISCSGAYFYCDDVGVGTGHHGPLLYHTLETPFRLSRFVKLQAEIEIDATSANQRGWIRVGLHAPDNATILTLQIGDPWTGTSAAYAQLLYKFANGTLVQTSQSYPDYANPEPCHETFAIVYNASGLYTSFPGITNSCLLSVPQLESTRVVKYISIQFNGYGDAALCETMRIHDIALSYGDTNAPVIESPSDLAYTEGSTGNSLTWTLYDTNPGTYQLWRDSRSIRSGVWNTSGDAITESVDGLSPGIHEYALEARDGYSNVATSTVSVTVYAPKTWYHDCSNMTGFSNLTDNTWALDEGIYEHQVVSGALESSGTYVYCSDYGNGTDWFGPLYTFKLSNPLLMSQFDELLVAMQVGCSADGELVRIDVILNDENHAPIMGISIHDGWAGDDAILPEAYWMFSNGSFIRINQGYANSVQTSYFEQLRIYINTTGFFAELPQVGTFKLVDAEQANFSRTVSYVSIHAMQWDTDPTCPIARFHNITLNWHTLEDLSPPIVDSLGDVIYCEGEVGNSITWHPWDTQPHYYEIFREEILIKTGLWNSSSEPISISVDGLTAGVYNYMIIVTDVGGNTAFDSVTVTVLASSTTATTTITTTTNMTQTGVPNVLLIISVGAGGTIIIVIIVIVLNAKKGQHGR